MTKPAVRPLVATGVHTEFGQVLDDPQALINTYGQARDLTYVPGFSDLRYARDKALSEGKTGKDVPTLPVNLRFVRRANKKGEPDNFKVQSSTNRKYRPVTVDDVAAKPAWLPEMPAGLEILPDGSMGHGDTMLMVTDAQNAAKLSAARQVRTHQLVTGSLGLTSEAGVEYESTPGTPFPIPAPSIDKR